MKNILLLLPFLLLLACGDSSVDTRNLTPEERSVLLTDSAAKMMRNPVESDAYARSLSLIDSALALNPTNKKAYFIKIQYYKRKGDPDAAFDVMVASSKNVPGDGFTALNMGMEYERRGDKEAAADQYEKAVKLFANALDTLDAKRPVVRNTYIMNLGMALTLGPSDISLGSVRNELSKAENENLDLALNTFKGMTREDLLLIQKNKSTDNRTAEPEKE